MYFNIKPLPKDKINLKHNFKAIKGGIKKVYNLVIYYPNKHITLNNSKELKILHDILIKNHITVNYDTLKLNISKFEFYSNTINNIKFKVFIK